MAITILLEFTFIIICNYHLNRNVLPERRNAIAIELIFIFFSLQVARIYYQLYFPDIPDYKTMFGYIRPLNEIGIFNVLQYFSNSMFDQTEYGYLLTISVFKCVFDNFEVFLLMVSIFQFLVAKKFCNYYNLEPFIVLPIFFALTFITFQIGMLRQAIAFVFLLLALIHIDDKKYFFIYIAIGLCFHRSMVFSLLLLWVNRDVNKYIMICSFIGALFIYLAQIEIIGRIWDYIARDDLGRVEFYLASDRENNYLGIGFWERVLIFVYMTLLKFKTEDNKNRTLTLLYNIGCVAIIFQLALYSSPTMTSRFRYYVIIAPTLYIFEAIRQNYTSKKTLYAIPIYIYLLFYSVYQASYIK